MQIRNIKLCQLQAYIDSEEFKTSPVIPISKHRALSHIRNPRAQPDDLVLVLIYEQDELVAYLGVFPDELHFPSGIERCGWLSCMWVNPKMRGKGIAKKLINTVFEAWDYRILVTEFTPAAKGLYDYTDQFLDLAKPKGIRCYRRLNLAYLQTKKNPEKWNKWKGSLRIIDSSFNLINSLRLTFFKPKPPTFQYLSEIDDEAWQFVQQHKQVEILNRQATDLRWLSNNPWLLSAPTADKDARRYHFSSSDKRFQFLNIKVYQDQSLIGFLILSIRNKNLKIPYAYFDPQHSPQIAQIIHHHMSTMQLDMLTTFQPTLLHYFKQNPKPFFKIREFERHYIISKVFASQIQNVPQFHIQDGDADAAFT